MEKVLPVNPTQNSISPSQWFFFMKYLLSQIRTQCEMSLIFASNKAPVKLNNSQVCQWVQTDLWMLYKHSNFVHHPQRNKGFATLPAVTVHLNALMLLPQLWNAHIWLYMNQIHREYDPFLLYSLALKALNSNPGMCFKLLWTWPAGSRGTGKSCYLVGWAH